MRPKDLSTPREQSRVSCEIANTRVCRATLLREVKAAQSAMNLGWFELFIVLSGRNSTGSSFSAPDSHEPFLIYHFTPLCTTILAVSHLLSSRNLGVDVPRQVGFEKVLNLVVN